MTATIRTGVDTVTISREVYDGIAQMLTQDMQDGVEFNSWALPIVKKFLEAGKHEQPHT